MSLATIILGPHDTVQFGRMESGEVVMTMPLDVIRRAYCDIVAEEIMQARAVAQPQAEGLPT